MHSQTKSGTQMPLFVIQTGQSPAYAHAVALSAVITVVALDLVGFTATLISARLATLVFSANLLATA
jgi:hypothetical protein